MYNIPKLMGHNESRAKRKVHSTKCLTEEIGEISCYQLNSPPESFRTKRSKHTEEEQTAGNNQTEG